MAKLPTKITVEVPRDVYDRLKAMGDEAGVDVAQLSRYVYPYCLEIYEGKKVA